MNEPESPLGHPDELLLDRLSHVGLNPITIRGIFLMMTRIHWSDPDNYGPMKLKLGKFVWSKDTTKSTLFIDYDYNYNPESMDKRPAIFVGTSDFEFRKVAVDNMRSRSEDRATDDYVMIASTNIIIRHIGKTPDESWAMGDLTSQFFLGMRKLLQDRLKVHGFDVTKLMASRPFEAPSQKADQQFLVDLLMALQFNSVWMITREGHRLKTVKMKHMTEYTIEAATPEEEKKLEESGKW
jgi:hypothetical protein